MHYFYDSKYDERRAYKVTSAIGHANTPIFTNIAKNTQIRNKWPNQCQPGNLHSTDDVVIHSMLHPAGLKKAKK